MSRLTPCPHCGTTSKMKYWCCPRCNQMHPVSARYCEAYQNCEIAALQSELSTLKFTVVSTVGGVDYEGNPTSEINYLQRLRILIEKEKQNAALLAACEAAYDGWLRGTSMYDDPILRMQLKAAIIAAKGDV